MALLAAGCVERRLVVESDPPGARVWVNGAEGGRTPARFRFHHYGHYRVVLRKPGFEKIEDIKRVRAPWYEYFPLDLVAEFLWPGKIVDERRFSYRLRPAPRREPDLLLKRAREKLKELPRAAAANSR